ncbi:MAG: nucleotidyltransferase domain-containing protein [Spirochaetaceae bacterium]
MNKLGISTKDQNILKLLIKDNIPNVVVWVYGSRITEQYSNYSDLDMVVFTNNNDNVFNLRESLQESDITFRVDLFIWADLPKEFQDNIKKNHIELSV